MKPANEKPDANEFGQLVAYLNQKGFSGQVIASIIGNNPNAYTRAELSQKLREYMKGLPKGA